MSEDSKRTRERVSMADRLKSLAQDPARLRALRRRAIVAAALVVLVVLPAWFATRPGFMNRYAPYQDDVETWRESVHANVACSSCHIRPGFFDQAKYVGQMVGEFYVSTVARSREPDLLRTPTNEACRQCHVDLRTVSPEGDLNIPHTAHVDVVGVDCVRCHAYLVHELNPEGTNHPRMETCLECHDGEQAKNACSTCHTEKAVPESHQAADWLVVHPQMQDEIDCEECHAWTDDWCVDCHSRRPRSHEGKWRSNHRYVVEERRNCEACHTGEFCVECHGEVPQLNFDPTLELVQ